LRDLLLNVTTSGPLEIDDIRRIRVALIENRIGDDGFSRLSLGRMTDSLAPNEFHGELDQILTARPEMAKIILRVLSMYCFQRQDRFEATAALFKKLVMHPEFRKSNARNEHDWRSAAIQLVMLETNERWYRELTEMILSIVASSHFVYLDGSYAEVLQLMLNRAPALVAPIVSEALNDPDDRKILRVGEFLARTNGWRDESGSLLWELEPVEFRSWLRQHPLLVETFLRYMPLFTQIKTGAERDESDLVLGPPRPFEYRWHPHNVVQQSPK